MLFQFKATVKIRSKNWSVYNQLRTHKQRYSGNYSSNFQAMFSCQTRKVSSLKSVQILENPLMCAHMGNVPFWCNYWLILKLVHIIASPADADKSAQESPPQKKSFYSLTLTASTAAGKGIGTILSFAIFWHMISVKIESYLILRGLYHRIKYADFKMRCSQNAYMNSSYTYTMLQHSTSGRE